MPIDMRDSVTRDIEREAIKKLQAIKRNFGVIIRYGDFEGEWLFEARFREFPHLISYGETLGKAYDLAYDALEVALNDNGAQAAIPALDD